MQSSISLMQSCLFTHKEKTHQSPVSLTTAGINQQETVSLLTVPNNFPASTLSKTFFTFSQGHSTSASSGWLSGFLTALCLCFCFFSHIHSAPSNVIQHPAFFFKCPPKPSAHIAQIPNQAYMQPVLWTVAPIAPAIFL